MLLWLALLLCLILIAYAGYYLSRYGDIIAEKTGMSASWVGLILLATATSLPELITGISAVSFANAPDIAVGDALGSTVFNLLILVILDVLYKRETMYNRAAQGHILSAALGALLVAFTGFSLLLDQAGMHMVLWHVGLYSPLIVLVYISAMRAVHRYEQRTLDAYTEASTERYPHVTLRQAVTGCVGGHRCRLQLTLYCHESCHSNGLGAKFCRYLASGGGDFCTRGGGHYFSFKNRCD